MSYENFSEVYDTYMNDIPYDEWVRQIFAIWDKFGLKPGLVCELACGTGNITQMLAGKGIDMIGIDISEGMLSKAKEKNSAAGTDILYLNQDMRSFELYGTVDSILCLCDSINYILDEDELLSVFKLVDNYLDPRGIFIFDINTEYKFKYELADNCYCETAENSAMTWENYYDEETGINEYYTNFFIKDELSDKYLRFEEYHYEKAYSADKIRNLLETAGLEIVGIFDDYTFNAPECDSKRLCFVARECKKNPNPGDQP